MPEKLLSQLSEEEMESFAKSFDTVITFCEGVLNKRGKEIPGSSSGIEILKKYGKRILYFNRDCTASRREISEKMRVTNYELKPNEIVCVTSLMAKYLKKRLDDKKVYVVGSPGISEELNVVGLRNFGTGPDTLTTDLATFVHSFVDDPEVGAVVVGFDEHFSYPKMLRAASYLSDPEVVLVAGSERSKTAAALVACIETCSEKKALIFEDSPSLIKDTLMDGYRIIPERTLIIGPGNNGDICLTQFHGFNDILSMNKDDSSPSELSAKTDENSTDVIFLHANDLAELASRLKI